MWANLLWALFSPAFERLLNEIWQAYESSKTEKRINQAFKLAQEQKNTEALSSEIGKLIK